jgi:hypothetical protein
MFRLFPLYERDLLWLIADQADDYFSRIATIDYKKTIKKNYLSCNMKPIMEHKKQKTQFLFEKYNGLCPYVTREHFQAPGRFRIAI